MTFNELVKKIRPKLVGITHRLNGRFTYFNEEDLYQEALIRLWQDFEAGKLGDKTDSYILQGCYYHLKNYIRCKENKACLVSIDALVGESDRDLEEILPSSDPKAYFDYLNSRLIVDKMRNNGLGDKEKKVLLLSLDGLTTREIGTRMHVSHVRVVKLRNRIKNRYEKLFREIK